MAMQVQPVGSGAVYGNHPAIQTVNPGFTQIINKADFDYFCCSFICGQYLACCVDRSRKYLYVLENGYEFNDSVREGICPGPDFVKRAYFDRGIYDMRAMPYRMGCVRGAPSVYPNNVRFVCCFQECSPGCNNFLECYFPDLCGDRLRVLPFEYYCCCIPTRACWLNNCCGICGVATGDPMPAVMYTFVSSLKVGSGLGLAQALEGSRAAWKARTNLP